MPLDKKTIAYYHPREIAADSTRASDIRVAQMLRSFEELGYDVWVIAGPPALRRKKIRQFKQAIKAGLDVAFVYGESTNAPIALAEKRLLPSFFPSDYWFFRWLRSAGIPCGLFYRDIHWRFELFHELLPWPLSQVLKPLYHLDWWAYDRYWQTLFLPSTAMNNHLPRPREPDSFAPLPPGYASSLQPKTEAEHPPENPLRLLYVGGIEPAVYDVSTLLDLAKESALSLTICCRPEEWRTHRDFYAGKLEESTNIVHASREEISRYYHTSDLFLMLMPATEYIDFAVPVKFYEAIGHALPMVSMNQPQIDCLIEREGIGWAISDLQELNDLLSRLSENRTELRAKRQKLMAFRNDCSWRDRAAAAASHLQATDQRNNAHTSADTIR